MCRQRVPDDGGCNMEAPLAELPASLRDIGKCISLGQQIIEPTKVHYHVEL